VLCVVFGTLEKSFWIFDVLLDKHVKCINPREKSFKF
jgi:hypothetical protein